MKTTVIVAWVVASFGGLAALAHGQGHELETMAISGQDGLTSIDAFAGINDGGTVAFTGAEGSTDRAYIATEPFAIQHVGGTAGSQNFLGATLNDSGDVACRDISGSTYRVRKWPTDGSLSWTQVARSPDDFDTVQFRMDVNESGVVAFAGNVDGSTAAALFCGTGPDLVLDPVELAVYPNGTTIRPQISDDNLIVIRDASDRIVGVRHPTGAIQTIAGTSVANGGFTATGSMPGIDATGEFVSFWGDGPEGAGVYLAVKGVFGDWERTRIVDEGGDFTFVDDGRRVAVATRGGLGDGAVATVVFRGERGGVDGIWSVECVVEFEAAGSSTVSVEVREPKCVVAIGDLLDDGEVSSLFLYDPVNSSGQVVVVANFTNGARAVVRATPARSLHVLSVGLDYDEDEPLVSGYMAQQVSDAFEDEDGFPNLVVNETVLLDATAPDATNRAAIEAAIAAIAAVVKPDDAFVMFLSGHGGQEFNPQPNEVTVEAEFDVNAPGVTLPHSGNEGLRSSLGEGFILDDDQLLAAFQADPIWDEVDKLFLLDLCFAGGFWGDLSLLPRVAVVASAPEGKFSVATGDTIASILYGQIVFTGVFAKAVVDTIEGLADSPNGSDFDQFVLDAVGVGGTSNGSIGVVQAISPSTADWGQEVLVVDFDLFCETTPDYEFIGVGGVAQTWVDLGQGLAGVAGVPVLAGQGPLTGLSDLTLSLASAAPSSPAFLVFGFEQASLSLKGGTLVPDPFSIVTGPSTDAAGALTITAPWPAGVPSLLSTYFQWWIVDGTSPSGLSASNGLVGTTP